MMPITWIRKAISLFQRPPSIQRQLLVGLLSAMTGIMICMVGWAYWTVNRQIHHLFDTQLIDGVKTIQVLLGSNIRNQNLLGLQQAWNAPAGLAPADPIWLPPVPLPNEPGFRVPPHTESRIIFQIWDVQQKKSLLHSTADGLPDRHIYHDWQASGFAKKTVGAHTWISFSQYDPIQKIQFVAAQRLDNRQAWVQQISWEHIQPMFWLYPVLAGLIWWMVAQAFQIVTAITHALHQRELRHLQPIFVTQKIPVEIRPLVDAINHLFSRLQYTFDREARFHADAAHELKTPLAAIRTQAQVALRENAIKDKNDILKKLIAGVDRATHVVQQLLILSQYDAHAYQTAFQPVALEPLVREACAEREADARQKNMEISFHNHYPDHDKRLERPRVAGDPIALRILFRNILDNAIRYSPPGSGIRVALFPDTSPGMGCVTITDPGPGIPESDRQRVLERFYRRLGHDVSGSGLGLSIVHQIAQFHGAELDLETPVSGTGLQVKFRFSEYDAGWRVDPIRQPPTDLSGAPT